MSRAEAAYEAMAEHVEADLDICCAELAITAADAVMFSDEAVERAARTLYEREGGRWAACPDDLRAEWIASVAATVAALKGDA